MHFTACYRGFLFPVEMQRLPQLSLFPVNFSFSSSIAHPALWVWLLVRHNSRFSTELSSIKLRPHFQATNRGTCHMVDTDEAPCHQIPEATPLVIRAGRVLGLVIVWSCWARDSVASKTHWDCDRLCLRRLCPPLKKNQKPLQPWLPAWKRWYTRKFLLRGARRSPD